MRLLQSILKDIRQGQNLDIYITSAIAIIVAILDILGVANQSIISAAILTILSVVLMGLLQNRRENALITRTLDRITKYEPSADLFFEKEFDREELKKIILRSQKVYFWSVTFNTTLRVLRYTIEQALLSGTEIHILLVEPNSLTSERSRFLDKSRKEKTNKGIRDTLTMLAEISTSIKAEKLEVRLVHYLPTCAMIAVNPHLQTGLLRIRLNTIHIPGKTRPSFTLFRNRDNEWFEFFYNQYELVWNEAESINLQTYK